jgi:hypothetical protein
MHNPKKATRVSPNLAPLHDTFRVPNGGHIRNSMLSALAPRYALQKRIFLVDIFADTRTSLSDVRPFLSATLCQDARSCFVRWAGKLSDNLEMASKYPPFSDTR